MGERALIWGGFPLVGAVLGWLLPIVADWAVSLPWFPFQGPLELAAGLPAPAATVGGLILGVATGVVLALVSESEYTTVTVDDNKVTLRNDTATRTVERADVTAVFRDGAALVLLGPDTGELARQGGDMPAQERLRAAFRRHGYPWRDDGDPHAEHYQRWVEDLPDLSASAHALLKARARALEREDRSDAEQLRSELAGLGVVLRDREGKQFWRPAPPDSR
ncbi:hypothetical protein EFW17_00505 [Halostreptopolyspora alba]|uniref:DUF308 domain-containing protein n=2 Tax=Halostreptopolyspora alba TaxID=2487137 RepID=A0A3N0EIV7_9ACTN|nr:hypothetical protein EFW17_00505 [Nocardiopsaceae bacterium YIM 96095]